ncbi:DEKNAAC102061 [Brettanomyces naardenensis]|uniref:DEKNAAC102061 n=1 Tax=Brettanomyces naardenensis TaxID=13370 RepID=A0A448YJQ5_BRENA|nr:DEKNAAC102061 [Brettanomyces naardenensis]
MKPWLLKVFLYLYLGSFVEASSNSTAGSASSIERPQFGQGFYLLGQFDAISNYNNLAKYNLSRPISSENQGIYQIPQDNITDDNLQLIQTDPFNGSSPTQLYSVDNKTVLAVVNGKPVLYDSDNQSSTQLEGWDSVTGDVDTVYVDQENSLAYIGGSLQYNVSSGALVYDLGSSKLLQLPFNGFNEGSRIQAITKYNSSIVFGGEFSSLGNKTLQTGSSNSSSNSSNSSTSSNSSSSLIQSEQPINLDNAIISTANSDGQSDPRSIICPSDSSAWGLSTAQIGGSWTAQLTTFVTPSKIRLYNGNSDGVKLFRIITAPADSIMNLTYIDPTTLQLTSCDAWCPLSQDSDLSTGLSGASNVTDGIYQISDVPGIRGTLGFSDSYQEFEFVDSTPLEAVTIEILDQYGNRAVLDGLQLFQYGLQVNANNTLNAAGCSNEQQIVSSSQTLGNVSWQQGIAGQFLTTTIPANEIQKDTQGVRYNPDLPASGDYTFLLYTTGCATDNTCDQRGIVNATLIAGNGTVLASELIYQTNEQLKYDEIFSGFIDKEDGAASPYLTVTFDSGFGSDEVTFVADYILVQFNSIDYTSTNESLSIPLNGLFEYSLSNFTDSKLQYPVGNSSINRIGSSSLSKNAQVNGLQIVNGSKLFVAGDFNSSFGDNFFGVDLTGYNETSDEITSEEFSVQGGLNGPVSDLSLANDSSLLLLGDFTGSNSTSSLDDVAAYDGSFRSLSVANPQSINSITPFTFNNTDYFIAGSNTSNSSIYSLDDSKQLVQSPTLDLNISQAASSFAFGQIVKFDDAADNAVFVGNDSSLNAQIHNPSNGSFNAGLYLNSSSVVLAGSNVVLLNNNESSIILEDLTFDSDSKVTSLFNYEDFLLVGFSGSASYKNETASGLVVYDLSKHNVTVPLIKNGGVSAIGIDPNSTDVVIAGNFTADGCSNFCLYNVSENSISEAISQNSISGINDLKFFSSSGALIAGNLSVGSGGHDVGSSSGFLAAYNSTTNSVSLISDESVPGPVVKFEFAAGNETTGLNDTIVVLGSNYVGYLNESKYTSLMDGVNNGSSTLFTDFALVNGTTDDLFYKNNLLVVSGSFNLTEYGLVSAAVYDGKLWSPLLISATDLNAENSLVNFVLTTSQGYSFNSTSSPKSPLASLQKSVKYFTKGQVAGVGCALAVGTTLLLTSLGGLVYLFSKRNTVVGPLKSRVGEDKMITAVPPSEVIDNMNKAREGL